MNADLPETVPTVPELSVPGTQGTTIPHTPVDANEKRLIALRDITGNFAEWAIRQSPYDLPDGLEMAVKSLTSQVKTVLREAHKTGKDSEFLSIIPTVMAWITKAELKKIVYDGVFSLPECKAWNTAKACPEQSLFFSSAYDGKTNPDYDIIDLDALVGNIVMHVWKESHPQYH